MCCCVRRRSLCVVRLLHSFFAACFFLLRLLRSFGGGGDFRIENAREVERESRKNCDAMYRSIDSRNFFRRFFAMMAKKRGRIDRSIVVVLRTLVVVAVSSSPWRGLFSSGLTRSLSLFLLSNQKGDWKQVGHVPRFVAGGLRREGRAGRAGVEEILLSTHAHVSRGSDRETFELQHARTTRIERFDLRLLLVWRKKERALVLLLLLLLLPLPRGCARACVY